jgi:heme exporter protein C
VTGALWARVMWGAYWNWDPRQTTIVISLTFYFGYLVLRSSIEDRETRARLSAAYALLGLAITPFLYFIVPRITFSLHPDSVVNARGTIDMESRMVQVLFASVAGFTALFFWMHRLQCRLLAQAERKSELGGQRYHG